MMPQPGSVIAHIFQAWEVSFRSISQAERVYFCWRKTRPTPTEIAVFEANEIQDTKKWAQRSLGWGFFCEETCLACFLLPRKSRLVNQNYLLGVRRDIRYLLDCNLAEIYLTGIFAWLNWPWVFHPFDFLHNFAGGDRGVQPFSAGDALVTIKALGGFFPESSDVFCRFFGGSDFAYFKQGKLITLDMFDWKKRWHETPLGGIMLRVETNLNALLGWSNPPHWRIPFHFEWHMSFNFWSH